MLCILLFYLLSAAVHAAPASLTGRDSLYYYILSPVPRELNKGLFINALQHSRLHPVLDSLGYYDQRRDTLAPDTIRIDPGRRVRIDSIALTGTTRITRDSLTRQTGPWPADPAFIGNLARQAVTWHARRGHPFCQVFASLHRIADSTTPGGSLGNLLTLDLHPDIACRIGAHQLTDTLKTTRRQIELDLLAPHGSLFDMELLRRSEQRLAMRPYLQQARYGAPLLRTAVEPPDTGEVVIPWYLEERSGLAVDGALALSSEQATTTVWGAINFTLLNLLGRGEAASLTYRGDRAQQHLSLDISKVGIASWPVNAGGSLGLRVVENNYGQLNAELRALVPVGTAYEAGMALRGSELTDTLQSGRTRFGGVDLLIWRAPAPYQAGAWCTELALRSGSGIADRQGRPFFRASFDLSAGVQVPLSPRQAVALHLAARSIYVTRGDTLHPAELFRTGGSGSVRGYGEEQFSFSGVGFMQGEYLFYYSTTGSLFIFADAGSGLAPGTSRFADRRTDLFGYGVGIRIPVRIGTAAVIWARNMQDTRSPGRIHVRLHNTLSTVRPW